MTAAKNRHILLGLVHKAALQLGWDDDWRAAQQLAQCGHASCRDMSDAQLLAWCWKLKKLGAQIGIPSPAKINALPHGPTRSQLGEIQRLALTLGWQKGLDAPELAEFIRHTCKIDHPRWLSKDQASLTIIGLCRWLKQKETNHEAT